MIYNGIYPYISLYIPIYPYILISLLLFLNLVATHVANDLHTWVQLRVPLIPNSQSASGLPVGGAPPPRTPHSQSASGLPVFTIGIWVWPHSYSY